MKNSALIRPPIDDGSGYRLRIRDADFVGIDQSHINLVLTRKCPLGMRRSAFKPFVKELLDALRLDGVTTADVRLQGSSAHIFSGWHKKMPYEGGQLLEELRANWPEFPASSDLRRAQRRLSELWPDRSDVRRPSRRLFDVMHRLGLHQQPSDYDIQISCDELVDRAINKLSEFDIDVPPEDIGPFIKHPTYRFVRNDLLRAICPHLHRWRMRQSSLIGRPVSTAVFRSKGPEDLNNRISSHFKETDWILHQGWLM